MKMYTNSEQTTKLIELGFDRPKGWCVEGISSRLIMYKHKEDDEDFNYSIGELLSFLPPKIWDDYAQIYWELCIDWDIIGNVWRVVYFHKALMRCYGKELIDALFDMVLRLKEEGVI